MEKGVEIRVNAKKSGNGYVDYEATVEPFMENFIRVYGYTRSNVIQIERALRRALREGLLPASVEEVAVKVIRQVLSCFNNNKVEKASVCMSVEKPDMTICAEVYYRIQGIATLTSTIRGGGAHSVERVVPMLDGELMDYIDKLTKEVVFVAGYAYNIWKEASRNV